MAPKGRVLRRDDQSAERFSRPPGRMRHGQSGAYPRRVRLKAGRHGEISLRAGRRQSDRGRADALSSRQHAVPVHADRLPDGLRVLCLDAGGLCALSDSGGNAGADRRSQSPPERRRPRGQRRADGQRRAARQLRQRDEVPAADERRARAEYVAARRVALDVRAGAEYVSPGRGRTAGDALRVAARPQRRDP